jgi:predicted ATPase/class 3 adenylate cyclase
VESAAPVVAFLFTDIEGSSRLWERAPGPMAEALARHDAIIRGAVAANRGTLVKTTGDGAHAVFADPLDAIRAAVALQRSFAAAAEEPGIALHVRCGVHAGVAQQRDGDWFGPVVNRAARLAAAAHGGQTLVSQAVAELVRARLPEGVALRDLGSIRLRDLASAERDFQVEHADLRREFPPLAAMAATPNNLPRELTSFVGRERDVDQVRRRLLECRLLTLIGAGGIGKTRLAVQAAAGILEAFPDGVWFVDLALIARPELVAGAIAGSLGLREEPGEPLVETIARYARDRRLLLLLDNCEHVGAACAQIAAALVRTAPGVAALATSREPLRVAGEATYPLQPLAVPGEDVEGAAWLERCDAVRLFVERARAQDARFALTDANAAAVARICRRLDGIPLAIELAAARTRSLALADVEARLADRFAFLTGGRRDVLPRQQTLAALIGWSYDLLDAAERCLLARLAAFAGGFDLATAEAVCAGPPVTRAEVADLLSSLVDKSLVIAEPDGDTMRYRQLETIVEFVRARWDPQDATATRARHASAFLRLAREAHAALVGPGQAAWCARLETEHANLRAALAWSLAEADVATALALCAHLYRFWHLRGHLTEGRRHVRAALAQAETPREPTRADAQYAGGVLAYYQGDLAEAKAMLLASLGARREHGGPLAIAAALSSLANVLQAEDDTAAARDYQERALALFREAGEPTGEGICLVNLGSLCTRRGEYRDARAYLEQSVEVGRRAGHGAVEGMGESNLGDIHALEGDLDAAAQRYATALGIARRIGDRTLEATSVAMLGDLAARRSDIAAARVLQRDGLALMRTLGVKTQLLAGLENAARLLAGCGELRDAVRLYAACAAARESLSLPAAPADALRVERETVAARSGLAENEFEGVYAAGRRLTLDEAAAFALGRLAAPSPAGPGHPPDAP